MQMISKSLILGFELVLSTWVDADSESLCESLANLVLGEQALEIRTNKLNK